MLQRYSIITLDGFSKEGYNQPTITIMLYESLIITLPSLTMFPVFASYQPIAVYIVSVSDASHRLIE